MAKAKKPPKDGTRQYRRVYTPAFKKQIVELCKIEGTVKRDIADKYDIPESALYEWIKNYDRYGTFDKATMRASKETEVERLKKRVAKLELENSILKDVALMLNKNQTLSSDK